MQSYLPASPALEAPAQADKLPQCRGSAWEQVLALSKNLTFVKDKSLKQKNQHIFTFKSLPEYPSVAAASLSILKPGSRFSCARIILRIFLRFSASGRSTYILEQRIWISMHFDKT